MLTVSAAPTGPVAHVSFVHVSQSTRVLSGTLDPIWDQSLLFHRVQLYGEPRGVRDEPPAVVVEVFDQDGGVHWGYPGVESTYRQWAATGGGIHALSLPCRVLGAFLGEVYAPQKCGWMWGAGRPPGCRDTHWRGQRGRPGNCWLPSSCCMRLR